MRSQVAILAAFVAVAGCTAGAPTPGQQQAATDSARAGADALTQRWINYTNTGQADSIGQLFVAEGMVLPPDLPAATGRDSIVARVRPLSVPGGTLAVQTDAFHASGDHAWGRGTFTYTIPAQGSTPAVTAHGKWMEHWQRANGQWLIAELIWNNDVPAPPAPAPARSR